MMRGDITHHCAKSIAGEAATDSGSPQRRRKGVVSQMKEAAK